MLGNQYFMSRRFAAAIPHFDTTLQRHPDDVHVQRRLIVSCVMTGSLDRALDQLQDYLDRQPRQNSNPALEDDFSLGHEILAEWIKDDAGSSNRFRYFLAAGILSAIYEPEVAAVFFKWAQHLAPQEKRLGTVLNMLKVPGSGFKVQGSRE